MPDFLDNAIGIYHFLTDRTPRSLPVVEPRPRHVGVNRFQSDGKTIVSKVAAGADLKDSIARCLELLGGLERATGRGDRVMVKPNFNSPDPFPGSTDLPFLQAVLELLLDAGAKVTLGECAGGMWRPTRTVFRKLGVYDLARRLGVELIAFEERREDWVKMRIDGDYLRSATMPRSAYEADRHVYLPCLKTHTLAAFSGALKLAMGLVHPGERRAFHMGHLQQKAAELNLCWQPDLILMDGRKAFVTVGPDRGQLEEPGLLLASGDLVAIDVEGIKVVQSYGAVNKLPPDPWQTPQIATALKHGLGAGPGEYEVVG